MKKIKQHWVAIMVIAIVLAVVIALIIGGYWISWTGFDGYDKVIKEFNPSGRLVKTTRESQPGKALWDWMQLLIIPVALAIGGFWFNQIQKDREQRAKDEREERAKANVFLRKLYSNIIQAYNDVKGVRRLLRATALYLSSENTRLPVKSSIRKRPKEP